MTMPKILASLGGLLLLSATSTGQPTINKVFSLSPAYDAGWTILPAASGGGYAIFGVQYANAGARPDAFCLRVDDNGNMLSHRVIGAPNTDEILRSAIALPDGWLAAGTKSSPISRGWLVRLDAAGQVLWERTYATLSKFHRLLALASGDYLAVGSLNNELLLIGLKADGTVIWQQSYPAPEGLDAYITAGGNACIVLGRDRLSKVHLGTKQLVWSKTVSFRNLPVGAPELGRLVGLAPLSGGLFAVIGSAYRELPTSLYTAHYAAVWTENGEPRWSRYLRGTARDDYDENEGFSVTYLPNAEDILFCGKVNNNISVTRTDLSGNIVEQKEIVTPGPIYGARLIRHGIHYVMTGAVFSGNMNTYFYRSAGNSLSMQVDDTPPSATLPADRWQLHQEPSQQRAWIVASAENVREVTFQLWALDGSLAREIRVWLTEGESRFPLDLVGLPDGLYWLSEKGATTPPKALVIQR
jgi:hypothetical protein